MTSIHRRAARRIAAAALILSTLFAAGCATTPAGVSNNDPIEPFNRAVYTFNDTLDKHIMKPVADAYLKVTPKPVQSSIANFYTNVTYPNVVVNEFLQGKFKLGFSDAGRFVINSTVGILGLFDPASHMGLGYHQEDIGQSLAVWGIPQGAYLVVPLVGPYTVRNTPNLIISTLTNVIYYVATPYVSIPLGVLGIINNRAQVSSSVNLVQQAAIDPYVFVREGYLQRREYLIYDGHPPIRYNYDEDFDEPDQPAPPGEPQQPAAPRPPAEPAPSQ